MNLKESFHYKNFLDERYDFVLTYIKPQIFLNKTNNHLRSKVKPDAEDLVEVEEKEIENSPHEILILLSELINEKLKISQKIGEAKAKLEFDLDATIEYNKNAREYAEKLKHICNMYTAGKVKERGSDYCFNAEGSQITYYYDIEVVKEEAYDRKALLATRKQLLKELDANSKAIELALLKDSIDFTPKFDINDSLEDMFEALKEET